MIKNQSMDNYDKSDKRPLSQNCILVYTFNWRTEKWTLPKQQQELKIMDNISCSRNDWILWEGNHHVLFFEYIFSLISKWTSGCRAKSCFDGTP